MRTPLAQAFRPSVVLALLYVAAFWAFLLLRPVGHQALVTIDDCVALLGALLAVPLCLGAPRGWRAVAAPGRRAPLLLALGILGYAVGSTLWNYDELITHQAPFPSWADAGYLSAYPFLLLGILALPTRQLPGVSRARLALDGLLLMTGIATVSWYFVLGPTVLQGGEALLAKVVGTAYPLCDLVLLLCVILLGLRGGNATLRPAMLLLAGGLALVVAADGVFDYQNLHGGYATGGWLDPVWTLGYLVIGLGARDARHAASHAGSTTRAATPALPTLWRSLRPYALLPVVAVTAVYAWRSGDNAAALPGLWAGSGALVGLVLLRQVVAMREMHALYANNDALNRANAQLETLATTDTLTGLPNRALLHACLDAAVAQSQRTAAPLALLLLDLDRFKEVNDTLGHHIGDGLLSAVAQRLADVVRREDTVARLGGDEFAVVLPAADVDGAGMVARTICAAIETPFDIEDQALSVGVSVGVAAFPEHGGDAATLLRHADVAMYAAKQGGLGPTVYDPTHDGHDATRLGLVGDLRQAIAAGAFTLHYQPKVALDSGRVCGVEALVRWPHPEHGLIPPDRFIPLAEQTGLIVPLTAWVLDEALRQGAAWAASGLEVAMAVNLSLRNLRDPQLCATVAAALARHAVSPGRLCLELTESVVMADVEGTQAVLERLAASGVRLAIDDFGTGYSSLAYLSRLPVDELKIDRSFVQRMAGTPQDQTIVASTIGLGHSLGLSIVTEGVEDAQTWALLGQMGSDEAQGYYLARPLPAPEAEVWLRQALNTCRRASA